MKTFDWTSKFLLIIAFQAVQYVAMAQPAARPDLSGDWQLDAARSAPNLHDSSGLSWRIEQNDGTIHLIENEGNKTVSDVRCATDGKDCKVKDAGRPATLSLYYNGPVLVELETSGHNNDTVVKRRFSLSPDGSALTIEVNQLMPEGKPAEKLVLTKTPGTHLATK